mmetsp:Transcript_29678/g.79690  ORF Transcript_29678/g.79690 Transcript_29678/m.79690 type:complete len:715 (-) Transcript_29678:189-2333(-)
MTRLIDRRVAALLSRMAHSTYSGLLSHELVDHGELARETYRVEELAQVKAVVVRGVALGMVRGREGGEFVPVDCIVAEEALHLLRYLGRCEGASPLRPQGLVHAHGATPRQLTQRAEAAQLRVGHAHILLVILRDLPTSAQGTQLCGRGCLHHGPQGRVAQVISTPVQEALQVRLRHAADGVHVRRGAVVLGHVSAQRLIHVGRAEDEEEALPAAAPGHELCQQVAVHHPQSRLYVLEGHIFRPGPSLGSKARLAWGERGEDLERTLHHRIDDGGHVVAAHLRGQRPRAVPRLCARVGRSHVASGEHQLGDLGCGRGQPGRLRAADAAQVGKHARVRPRGAVQRGRPRRTSRGDRLEQGLAHAAHNARSRARVRAPGQCEEVARCPGPAEVVPQPARGAVGDLLLGRVHEGRERRRGQHGRGRAPRRAQREIGNADTRYCSCSSCLVGPRCEGGPGRAHGLEVHRGGHHLHVAQGELRALRHNVAVNRHERAAVVVAPSAVTALLVGVDVAPTSLGSGRAEEGHALVQLAQLVVGARAVGDDLHAVQSKGDVGRVGGEELLASLAPKARVRQRECSEADGRGALATSGGAHHCGEGEVLDAAREAPRREPAALTVVAIVGEVELGANEQHARVEAEHAAVVAHALVQDGHAKIAEQVARGAGAQEVREGLPRVQQRVLLEEVVFAPVARDLELRAKAVARPKLARTSNRFFNAR